MKIDFWKSEKGESFLWDWIPFYNEKRRWHEKGYVRVRVLGYGFNLWWGWKEGMN